MVIFKIKSDHVSSLREWGKKLMNELKEAAQETLREEQCTHEFFYLFQINDDWYAAAHMEGDVVPANMERQINIEHRNVLRKAIEKKIPLSEVYDLTA